MTEITYIDDFDYIPEAAYVDDTEMYYEMTKSGSPNDGSVQREKEAKLLEVNENTTIHVQSVLATGTKESKTPRPCQIWESPQYRPLEKQEMKPWKGPLTHPPDKIVFATWLDYLSYKEAWAKKQGSIVFSPSHHRN